MRGSETWHPSGMSSLMWRFLIPMRGSEADNVTENNALLTKFLIPMRGSESGWMRALSWVGRVSDPHEG